LTLRHTRARAEVAQTVVIADDPRLNGPRLGPPKLDVSSIPPPITIKQSSRACTHLLPKVTSCLLSPSVVLLLGLHLVRRVLLGVGVLSSPGLLLGGVVVLPADDQDDRCKAGQRILERVALSDWPLENIDAGRRMDPELEEARGLLGGRGANERGRHSPLRRLGRVELVVAVLSTVRRLRCPSDTRTEARARARTRGGSGQMETGINDNAVSTMTTRSQPGPWQDVGLLTLIPASRSRDMARRRREGKKEREAEGQRRLAARRRRARGALRNTRGGCPPQVARRAASPLTAPSAVTSETSRRSSGQVSSPI
jgi:hypothetical protein